MEIQKTNNIPDEDIQALSQFANACYTKGCRDTLIGVGIGAALTIVGCIGAEVYYTWKEKKELKKSINDFCTFVEEESQQGLFLFTSQKSQLLLWKTD